MRKNKSETLEVEVSPKKIRSLFMKAMKNTLLAVGAGIVGFAIAKSTGKDSV